MDAQELRIGNYIEFDNNGTPVVVKQLSENDVYYNSGCISCYRSMNGILITEEWLLKFGFEKWIDGVYYLEVEYYPKRKYKIRVFERIGHVFLDHDKMIKSDLKHVHQLQNLYFALTGKELRI